jgi:cell division cycle 14
MDWASPHSGFDLGKYEHYEQVINGDWNWILPGKFIAVSGPTCTRRDQSTYCTLGCEDYVPIFKREGVTAIVRLNKAVRCLLN